MSETFELAGKHFCYQESEYNGTRRNERAVEVPVGLFLLSQAANGESSVLEVGAVLPHYRAGWPADGHTVIDLHEVYPGVTNADVLEWEPSQQFDLIVSISTLDHLINEDEFYSGLARLKVWLAPGGLLCITLPYGQPVEVGGGPWIDDFLRATHCFLTPTYSNQEYHAGRAAVWRMDKFEPTRHLWSQIEHSKKPKAYHGQSPAANTVYFLLWGDVAHWWQT